MINKSNIIHDQSSATEALQRLNTLSTHLTLFVVTAESKMCGTVTDGDIRRGLLAGLSIADSVDKFMCRSFRYLVQGAYHVDTFETLRHDKIKIVPVLNGQHQIIDVIDFTYYYSYLPMDVLLMAGGEGMRLRPLTAHVPKPMLKVAGKPLLHHNIERLKKFGITNFYISVRYLPHKIIDYFGDGASMDVCFNYLREQEPLGTIGCASMITNMHHDHLLVMNADLLTDIDLEQMFLKMQHSNADMMVATVPYMINVPYGVIETASEDVISLVEKPSYVYNTNAGIYIIKKNILSEIPHQAFFNATDLMQLLIEKKYKLINYPIHSFWLDIGRPEDYQRATEMFSMLKY